MINRKDAKSAKEEEEEIKTSAYLCDILCVPLRLKQLLLVVDDTVMLKKHY